MFQQDVAVIEIDEICRKIFRDTVLDVFYLIQKYQEISKTQIAQHIHEAIGNADGKSQKCRNRINEAIAKLEGALFIDSFVDGARGAPTKYFLTNYGQTAQDILAVMIEQDPSILKGSVIVSKVVEGEE